MIRDKFLNWLVSGRQTLDEQQLKEKFEFYQIPLCGEEFQIIAVHIESLDFPVSMEKNMDDLLQTAIKSIEDTLSDYPNCVVFTDSFYQCNILMGYEKNSGSPGPGTPLICRLLRELDLPYALLDDGGKVIWTNAAFENIVHQPKGYRKSDRKSVV